MKIAEINMVDYGSTGKIMLQIAECAREKGNEVKTFSKKWKKQIRRNAYHTYYGSTLENGLHVFLYKFIGFQGLFSYFGTQQLVHELEKFQPDIIHLHNLHDSSTCLPVLFAYIKKNDIQTVWTLHDCWSMTGQCPYFTMVKCDKWRNGCYNCPQLTSKLPIDCSKYMWRKKKAWFTGIKHMVLVTPSRWLADIVQESYLQGYPVKVINNGIDLSIFKPRKNELRNMLNIKGHLILGVALGWGIRKGLDVFLELAKRLPESYKIVMVGTDEKTDRLLPERILSIHRTHDQRELAELYSAADVFINPTREDTFPTTNIEALACGTPVITYRTGGSPEILDKDCGCVINCNDIDALEKEIVSICENRLYSKEKCVRRAKMYDKNDRFQEYVELFETLFEIGGGYRVIDISVRICSPISEHRKAC